jgi:allantoinase
MSQFDLILRGGIIVTPDGQRAADIGIADQSIVAVAPGLSGEAQKEIDATGLHIFPGLIDAHVHFNEPGRADWEGIETGSRALAAGGGTMFFDMPLNAHPPTCDAESFDLKLAAARQNSLTDFAFWGGLVPQNLDQLDALAKRGVIGFKAFMSDSGIDDFSSVDDAILREGMKRAAQLNLPVAIHAESEILTKTLAAERIAQGKLSVRDYLDSRPIQAELVAIRRALELAGETKCALQIVHVSSGEGVALIAAARQNGVNVTCETCPHYLTLTEDDVEKLGAIAKCAPPLRDPATVADLWKYVLSDDVTTIGSDHSPSPPGMKQDKNFFKVWGGISGVQHTLPLLLESRNKYSLALSAIAKLTSFNVAERFRLSKAKGRIEIGADADLALVDLREKFTVRPEDLFYRHQQSPYVGRALTGRVVQTILRGKTIFKDGQIIGARCGQFIKPL